MIAQYQAATHLSTDQNKLVRLRFAIPFIHFLYSFFRVPRVVGIRAVRVIYTDAACGPLVCFTEPEVLMRVVSMWAAMWWPLTTSERDASGPVVAGPLRPDLINEFPSAGRAPEDRAYGWSSGSEL